MTRLVFLTAGAIAVTACGGRIETLMPRDTVVQASGTQLEPSAQLEPGASVGSAGAGSDVAGAALPAGTSAASTASAPPSGASIIAFEPVPDDDSMRTWPPSAAPR